MGSPFLRLLLFVQVQPWKEVEAIHVHQTSPNPYDPKQSRILCRSILAFLEADFAEQRHQQSLLFLHRSPFFSEMNHNP
jgi:hypothetical protein